MRTFALDQVLEAVRGGKASEVFDLGSQAKFDPDTREFHCLERGETGMFPMGSLGLYFGRSTATGYEMFAERDLGDDGKALITALAEVKDGGFRFGGVVNNKQVVAISHTEVRVIPVNIVGFAAVVLSGPNNAASLTGLDEEGQNVDVSLEPVAA